MESSTPPAVAAPPGQVVETAELSQLARLALEQLDELYGVKLAAVVLAAQQVEGRVNWKFNLQLRRWERPAAPTDRGGAD
jgi:hypothetical protein